MKNGESKQLSAAAAYSQNGSIRVDAVQIGICGDDDPKTLPRLIPPCPRCGYCGFIEDSDMNLVGVCPECRGEGRSIIHHNDDAALHGKVHSDKQS